MFHSEVRYLLSGRFRFRDPMLFRARARLTAEHIELVGWHWQGRYHRRIQLQDVLHTDVGVDNELILWLSSGEAVRLRIREAEVWSRAIDRQISTNRST